MTKESRVNLGNGDVYYKILGTGKATPVIVLHGGPGFPHNYLLSLSPLGNHRPIFFYDQIGCGKSARPEKPSLWKMRTFVEELEKLRAYLQIEKFHLYGHSWGTMLGIDYYLKFPGRVQSLILASACLSTPFWLADVQRLKERAIKPPPEKKSRAMDESSDGFSDAVYETMWGPSEDLPTGNLKHYNRTADLGKIKVPTLYTCGRHDDSTPETVAKFCTLTPGAQLKIFEKSGHCAHIDETQAYISCVEKFLKTASEKI